MLFSFGLTFVILVVLINYQKKNRIGQTVREEGLKTHREKNNTPIFGGVAFNIVISLLISYLLIINVIDVYVYLLIIVPLIGYSTLGFIDDYIILKNKKNNGIKPNLKFLIQIVIAIIYFIIYLLFEFDTDINLGFIHIELKFLYGIFILLAFSGFTNATNLTDGIDGLLAGSFSIVLIGLFLIVKEEYMRVIISVIFASLSAFLYFNLPKAKIFMGDTGSLGIGAIFVSLFIILKLEYLMFIFGLLYIIEVLSVIIQVGYFKITKGKRVFKMTPLHHHFEITLCSEKKTLFLFYFITIISTVLALVIYRVNL